MDIPSKTTKKLRILTGDRPTGPLHLGHYFGSLQKRIELQNQGHQVFIIIADFQVLTDRLETSPIEKNIFELVLDYLAVGLDPQRTTIFVQSQIPELAELTIYFSMLAPLGQLQRNPTVKEEIKSAGLGKNISLGMLSYPVSQAADILLFMADAVPVGEDQLPHLELTRDIAKKFNRCYQSIFKIPQPILGTCPRLMGLDGFQKMSKSRGNAIFLSDEEEVVYQKIKKAITDSGREIKFDPKNKPYISNLMTFYHLVTGQDYKKIEEKYQGKGYQEFKEDLAQAINSFLKPIREKRKELAQEPDYVYRVLREGTQRAREEAQKNMRVIKKALKMDYSQIFS